MCACVCPQHPWVSCDSRCTRFPLLLGLLGWASRSWLFTQQCGHPDKPSGAFQGFLCHREMGRGIAPQWGTAGPPCPRKGPAPGWAEHPTGAVTWGFQRTPQCQRRAPAQHRRTSPPCCISTSSTEQQQRSTSTVAQITPYMGRVPSTVTTGERVAQRGSTSAPVLGPSAAPVSQDRVPSPGPVHRYRTSTPL